MICASPLTAVQTLAEVLVVTGAAVLVLGRHSSILLRGSLMMSFHLLT